MISVSTLVAAGVKPTQARLFADPLAAACARFDIGTPARVAAFLGQCMVESGLLTKTEEDLSYRTPERILMVFGDRISGGIRQAQGLTGHPVELANVVYASRNGNCLPGDGWRFRGRGLIEITGRAIYAAAAARTGRPYLEDPDLVAKPDDAALSAAAYWAGHKLNALADSWQIDAITKVVNGRAMLHADLRQQYSEQALKGMR